jgi:hypothetical protein
MPKRKKPAPFAKPEIETRLRRAVLEYTRALAEIDHYKRNGVSGDRNNAIKELSATIGRLDLTIDCLCTQLDFHRKLSREFKSLRRKFSKVQNRKAPMAKEPSSRGDGGQNSGPEA